MLRIQRDPNHCLLTIGAHSFSVGCGDADQISAFSFAVSDSINRLLSGQIPLNISLFTALQHTLRIEGLPQALTLAILDPNERPVTAIQGVTLVTLLRAFKPALDEDFEVWEFNELEAIATALSAPVARSFDRAASDLAPPASKIESISLVEETDVDLTNAHSVRMCEYHEGSYEELELAFNAYGFKQDGQYTLRTSAKHNEEPKAFIRDPQRNYLGTVSSERITLWGRGQPLQFPVKICDSNTAIELVPHHHVLLRHNHRPALLDLTTGNVSPINRFLGVPMWQYTDDDFILQINPDGLLRYKDHTNRAHRILQLRGKPSSALYLGDKEIEFLVASRGHISLYRFSGRAQSVQHLWRLTGLPLDSVRDRDKKLWIILGTVDGERLVATWCPSACQLRQYRLPSRIKASNIYRLDQHVIVSEGEQFYSLDIDQPSRIRSWLVPGGTDVFAPRLQGGICYTIGSELNLRRVSDFKCIGRLPLSYGPPDAWTLDPNGTVLLQYGNDLVRCVREGFLRLVDDENG
ncbi:MAG: hypothetical protein ACON3Z_01985 [Bradymonadia bacterium]